MSEAVDYFSNHQLKLRFPWRLYHGPIVERLAEVVRDAPGPAVLNVGSGPFLELPQLPSENRRFTVCDIDARAVELARRLHGDRLAGADVIAAGQPLPYPDRQFDLVVAMDVIEHIISPLPWLSDLIRVTKPGGALYLTTPNYGSLSLNLIERTALELIARMQGFTRRGLHPTPLDPAGVGDLLRRAGAERIDLRTISLGWVVAANAAGRPRLEPGEMIGTVRPRLPSLGLGAIAIAAVAGITVAALEDLLYLPDPTRIAPLPAAAPPLTRHLALVVVDGLRYDFAIDPARAPNFARHMQRDAHALVWAGRVTMTAAAALTIATGERADFSQITTNFSTPRARANHLLDSVRDAGLRTALVGDVLWHQALGRFDEEVTDPNGMAMEVDDSPEMFEAAIRIAASPPNLLIAHFITPDHQGHAWSVTSDRYRDFLLGFDQRLERFLDGLGADTTVVVMSDHGATDSGAHGMDLPVARRTPLFAFGPGIRAGADAGEIDQVDVGYTLAALLGVPGPLQGRGTAATQLLAVDAPTAAALACHDAERVARLAAAERTALDGTAATLASCRRAAGRPADATEARAASARSLVRRYDAVVDARAAAAGHAGTRMVAVLLLAFLLGVALFAHRLGLARSRARGFHLFAAIGFTLTASLALTWAVERLPPPGDHVVRALLLVAGNGALVYALLRPSRGARLYRRWPEAGMALFPGLLAASYPAYTGPESMIVLVFAAALWTFAPYADQAELSSPRPREPALPWARLALLWLALVALAPFGFDNEDPLPAFAAGRPWLLVGAGCLAVALWLFGNAGARLERAPPGSSARRWEAAIGWAVACGAVLLRRVVPWPIGIAATVLLPLLAWAIARRGRRSLAWGVAFAGYAMVSRDGELVAVACAAAAAEAVAQATAGARLPSRDRPEAGASFWATATVVATLFAATFLGRLGLQRGLEFPAMDWAAGAFGDPNVSALRIGLSLCWKYCLVFLLIVGVTISPLPLSLRRSVAALVTILAVVRAGLLALVLFVCRASYYPSLRAMSDFPSAALLAVAAAAILMADSHRAEHAPGAPARTT